MPTCAKWRWASTCSCSTAHRRRKSTLATWPRTWQDDAAPHAPARGGRSSSPQPWTSTASVDLRPMRSSRRRSRSASTTNDDRAVAAHRLASIIDFDKVAVLDAAPSSRASAQIVELLRDGALCPPRRRAPRRRAPPSGMSSALGDGTSCSAPPTAESARARPPRTDSWTRAASSNVPTCARHECSRSTTCPRLRARTVTTSSPSPRASTPSTSWQKLLEAGSVASGGTAVIPSGLYQRPHAT